MVIEMMMASGAIHKYYYYIQLLFHLFVVCLFFSYICIYRSRAAAAYSASPALLPTAPEHPINDNSIIRMSYQASMKNKLLCQSVCEHNRF